MALIDIVYDCHKPALIGLSVMVLIAQMLMMLGTPSKSMRIA